MQKGTTLSWSNDDLLNEKEQAWACSLEELPQGVIHSRRLRLPYAVDRYIRAPKDRVLECIKQMAQGRENETWLCSIHGTRYSVRLKVFSYTYGSPQEKEDAAYLHERKIFKRALEGQGSIIPFSYGFYKFIFEGKSFIGHVYEDVEGQNLAEYALAASDESLECLVESVYRTTFELHKVNLACCISSAAGVRILADATKTNFFPAVVFTDFSSALFIKDCITTGTPWTITERTSLDALWCAVSPRVADLHERWKTSKGMAWCEKLLSERAHYERRDYWLPQDDCHSDASFDEYNVPVLQSGQQLPLSLQTLLNNKTLRASEDNNSPGILHKKRDRAIRLSSVLMTSSKVYLVLETPIKTGTGQKSHVWRCRLETGRGKSRGVFALKLYDGLHEQDDAPSAHEDYVRERSLYEVMVLAQGSLIPHSYGFFEFAIPDGATCPGHIMEWIEGISLTQYMSGIPLSERQIAVHKLAESLLTTYIEIHKMSVSHEDIANRNLILLPPKSTTYSACNFNFVVLDFSYSRTVDEMDEMDELYELFGMTTNGGYFSVDGTTISHVWFDGPKEIEEIFLHWIKTEGQALNKKLITLPKNMSPEDRELSYWSEGQTS